MTSASATRWCIGATIVGAIVTCLTTATLFASSLLAQGRPPSYLLSNIPDSVRRKHMVQVSPHVLVLDPSNRSATVEFTNAGDKSVTANVAIQMGFTYWQNADTSFTPTPGKSLRGHDTVIVSPRASDRYAGNWITGVPESITLKPGETRRVTLRINPPSSLPNGEYYARIVTTVGSRVKRAAVSRDTAASGTIAFPVTGWELPILRDSVRVFFRKGPQTMGVKIVRAEAEIDTADYPIEDVGPHPLRVLLQLQLTGTAHFEGKIEMSYLIPHGDETYLMGSEGAAFAMLRDGIMRWSVETDHMPPGEYHLRVRFVGQQKAFPQDEQIPMTPVEVEIPFTVPTWATGVEAMPAIGTGQNMQGGGNDPYWFHIDGGPIDYNSGNALTMRGHPAVVLSAAGGGFVGAWGARSATPQDDFNNGWDGSSDATTSAAPIGENVLRTFVDLSDRKILTKQLAGVFWSDDCTDAIYINGQELTSFEGAGLCGDQGSWSTGYPFTIGVDDGLVDGVNVIDFMYRKTDDAWDGVRIDFRSIFRETHDK